MMMNNDMFEFMVHEVTSFVCVAPAVPTLLVPNPSRGTPAVGILTNSGGESG